MNNAETLKAFLHTRTLIVVLSREYVPHNGISSSSSSCPLSDVLHVPSQYNGHLSCKAHTYRHSQVIGICKTCICKQQPKQFPPHSELFPDNSISLFPLHSLCLSLYALHCTAVATCCTSFSQQQHERMCARIQRPTPTRLQYK